MDHAAISKEAGAAAPETFRYRRISVVITRGAGDTTPKQEVIVQDGQASRAYVIAEMGGATMLHFCQLLDRWNRSGFVRDGLGAFTILNHYHSLP